MVVIGVISVVAGFVVAEFVAGIMAADWPGLYVWFRWMLVVLVRWLRTPLVEVGLGDWVLFRLMLIALGR